MNRHWTDDDFIGKVYGVGPEDGHLDECATCRQAWMRCETTRGLVLASQRQQVPVAVLAAQRRAIMDGIGARGNALAKRLIPVLAAAGAVALGLFLTLPPEHRPTIPPKTGIEDPMTDAQLFQETAAMGRPAQPRGAKPIEALFE